jgi:type II secretory ATPase GspE/PulE/Tfp pilus assembly ATPase PilB-like protein
MSNSFFPAYAGEGPIEGDAVFILDELVRRAARFGSSDMHLEPKRDHMQVRFRIDGATTEEVLRVT